MSEKTQRFDVSMTSFSSEKIKYRYETDVMETSKRCVFSLIFILKCLTKFNLFFYDIRKVG